MGEQNQVRDNQAEEELQPLTHSPAESYAPGEPIDIWALYARALQNDEFNVRYVAREQLALLDAAQAAELLAEDPGP